MKGHHSYNRLQSKLAPHQLLRLAALAVLVLLGLSVSQYPCTLSNSHATIHWIAARTRSQQPAVALHGHLQTCPLPGYCYKKVGSRSSSQERHPSEPVVSAYKQTLKLYLATQAFEERKAHLAGLPDARGIVFVGGGKDMLGAITASLWTLRHKLNCTLPAEIAYIGKKNEVEPAAIAALNATLGPVYALDLSAVPYPAHHNPAGQHVLEFPGHKALKRPYEAKAWALYNSRFRQVLMSDFDAYPLINPEVLFEGPHMTLQGNLHWADIACRHRDSKETSQVCGQWRSKAMDRAMEVLGISNTTLDLLAGTQPLPGMAESGHVLLDRVRHADVLEYLWWITTHSDEIYNILWGDKDTFMLAFAAANKAAMYAQIPIPPAAALRGKSGEHHQLNAMVQHDHFGRQAWVHNTLNKHRLWAKGPPAPYTLVTGPMPEWVGTQLVFAPNGYTIHTSRLLPLRVEQPEATPLQSCPQAVWSHWLRVQALGIALLPQPALVAACEKEVAQVLEHGSSITSTSVHVPVSGLRKLQARQLQEVASDACIQAQPAAGHLELLLQQQAAHQQLPPVQWASVLVGRAAVNELVHAQAAPANTPAGIANLEREGLASWLAAAEVPSVLTYLNWHLMAAQTPPAACSAAGPGRVANPEGAMPVLQLRMPGDTAVAGPPQGLTAWSALELAQVEWIPQAVKWIQATDVVRVHMQR